MKKFQSVLTLALATSLFVQPIMAETVKTEQPTLTVEAENKVPEVKVEVKEEVKTVENPVVKPVAKKPEKTFKIKPVVVNGVSYVSIKDLEKHLGVKWESSPKLNDVQIKGPNAVVRFRDFPGSPEVNRQFLPCNYKMKKFNGVIHVPAKYVFEAFNSKIVYDKVSKTLTVDYYGKHDAPKLVDTQMNTIKGRVLDKYGNPVKGAKVNFSTFNAKGDIISVTEEKRPNFPVEVLTDENGYYEFAPLDTDRHVRININVDYTVNGTVYEGYTGGTFDYTKGALEDSSIRLNSKMETMPTIYTDAYPWSN